MKPVHIVMAISAPAIWGLGFALSKLGTGHFPPMFLMACRYTLAAAVLIWFVKPPWPLMRKILLVSIVSGTIPYGLVYTGLKEIDASTAMLVVQTQVPFLAILGVIILKERLGVRQILGMVLAFIGLGLIFGEPRVHSNLLPLFMVIVGGLVWAFGQILIRKLGGAVGGIQLLAWVAALSAPQLFALSFLLEEGQGTAVATAGWQDWAVILYVGLIMTAFAYPLWYHLLGACEVNLVAPFLLINPISAVTASILILGEEPTFLVAAGGAIVISGIAVMTIKRQASDGSSKPG